MEIWGHRESLFPHRQVTALQILEPAVLAHVLGAEYLELDNLSDQVFSFRGKNFKVGGLVDRQAGKIAVSTECSMEATRFTGAHELGHWILHPEQTMHRDIALDGSQVNSVKPPFEKEADFFAATFLMPEKLVLHYFQESFQTELPFVFHETHAFHVCPQRADMLVHAQPNTLERELALARCRSFGGRPFASLAETFRVSNMAMAIRLKELNLVQWP